jgi:prepilin-type processing-associated H-X9-DG protein
MRIAARAFSFVELLIVVLILAALVTMLLPSLSRARVLAKKAACAGRMKVFGPAIGMYYAANRSYPFMGNANLADAANPELAGYPMMATVMAMNNVTPTRTNAGPGGLPVYQPTTLADMWKGALCPAMNAQDLVTWTQTNMTKAYVQRVGVGYQWNVCLRAATPNEAFYHCGIGRWSPRPENAGSHPEANVGVDSIDPKLYLPNGNTYYAQAATPDEVDNPRIVAQAWDSFDLNSFQDPQYSGALENYAPGWHVGPASYHSKGQAVLNAARHDSGPNILYVDGHVAADAGKELAPGDMDAGSWTGIKAVTWGDHDAIYGTMQHIVPQIDPTTPP